MDCDRPTSVKNNTNMNLKIMFLPLSEPVLSRIHKELLLILVQEVYCDKSEPCEKKNDFSVDPLDVLLLRI